jgi:uncharacterized phage protein (TIGR01671 family)
MIRTIKFRAWDSEKKEMYFPCVLSFVENKVSSLIKCDDGNRKYVEHELMQFTGLIDKKGKEIFEGDIIHFTKHDGYLLDNFIGNVIFIEDESSFGYRIFGYDYPFNRTDEIHNDLLNHCEIIGNIYENNEILP